MATDLYETLGLDKNASPEDIRKAYYKRALKTHPDRLPPQTSEADKAAASEAFRKVNNAYEVLNDEKNRKLYNRYGVWPPPTNGPEPGAESSRAYSQKFTNEPFNDPFFSSGFGGSAFHFTDPFVLFSSLFGDIHNLHRNFFEDDDPFFSDPFPSPFSRSPFGNSFGLSTRPPFGSLFGPGPMFSGFLDSANTRVSSQVSDAVGRSGRWVSQSTVTRSINGRTEQVTKRRDAQGNEHIVYSSPEGERYTINGVDQPLPITNGNAANMGRTAAPRQPSPHTRPALQAIGAAPPVSASSYYAPPPTQPAPVPVQSASPPPAYYPPSATSGSYAYPTRPSGPLDRAPAAHRDAMPADPRTSVHRTRSASSQGHAGHVHPRPLTTPPPTAYASSLHSYRPDRDQERHHRRDAERERDSHHTHVGGAPYVEAGRASHHSHRDYQPMPESVHGVRDEQGAPPHKRWRVGGWLNGLTKFLKNHTRRHESAGAH